MPEAPFPTEKVEVRYILLKQVKPLSPANEIVVTTEDARRLADQFQATWRRPPQPAELDALVDDFIKEEVYVREALALGLDQNDTLVRRRLRQKMEFLSEAPVSAAPSDEAALLAYYDENKDAYSSPPRIAFRQVLLSGDGPSPDAILDKLNAGVDARTLGARTLLPLSVPLSTEQAVDSSFGTGFFRQIEQLPQGEWVPNVTSGFGTHIVILDGVRLSQTAPFEDVRDRVEQAWRAAESEKQREDFIQRLSASYSITRPDPGEVLN